MLNISWRSQRRVPIALGWRDVLTAALATLLGLYVGHGGYANAEVSARQVIREWRKLPLVHDALKISYRAVEQHVSLPVDVTSGAPFSIHDPIDAAAAAPLLSHRLTFVADSSGDMSLTLDGEQFHREADQVSVKTISQAWALNEREYSFLASDQTGVVEHLGLLCREPSKTTSFFAMTKAMGIGLRYDPLLLCAATGHDVESLEVLERKLAGHESQVFVVLPRIRSKNWFTEIECDAQSPFAPYTLSMIRKLDDGGTIVRGTLKLSYVGESRDIASLTGWTWEVFGDEEELKSRESVEVESVEFDIEPIPEEFTVQFPSGTHVRETQGSPWNRAGTRYWIQRDGVLEPMDDDQYGIPPTKARDVPNSRVRDLEMWLKECEFDMPNARSDPANATSISLLL